MTESSVQPEDKVLLDANVRRVVGVSALRRIRQLVDEHNEDDLHRKVLAKYMVIAFGAGATLLTLSCLVSPQFVISILRSLVSFVRGSGTI